MIQIHTLSQAGGDVVVPCPHGKKARVVAFIGNISGAVDHDQAAVAYFPTPGEAVARAGGAALTASVVAIAAGLHVQPNPPSVETPATGALSSLFTTTNIPLPDIWFHQQFRCSIACTVANVDSSTLVYELQEED